MKFLKDLLKKHESLVALDLGATALKLVELDITGEKPRLCNIALMKIGADVFSGNVLSKAEKVSEIISTLLEESQIADKRVITAMPAPSVFTKRIKMQKMDYDELDNNIQFEAGNFIPHSLDAVKLDYHIIGDAGKNQLDILIVAVKNEIIDSFLDCFSLAGLEAAVVDVDYFALQNVFEFNYPEYISKTTALINIGARYSSINICQGGQSLFTGDISVGGKLITDAISEELQVSVEEAEKYKVSQDSRGDHKVEVEDIIDRSIEQVASEFNRQLSFFWSASGSDDGIDHIMLSGGGAKLPGLVDELSEKTGLKCESMDPFRHVMCDTSFDKVYLKDLAPLMSVGLGLAMRQPGDKIFPSS